MATEFGKQGVRCNAISPGFIVIPEKAGTAAATGDLSPEAIAPLVVWLASAESREVTGRVLGVWGNGSPCWKAG